MGEKDDLSPADFAFEEGPGAGGISADSAIPPDYDFDDSSSGSADYSQDEEETGQPMSHNSDHEQIDAFGPAADESPGSPVDDSSSRAGADAEEEFDDGYHHPAATTEETAPIYRQRWVKFLAIGLLIMGGFGFGYYKSVTKKQARGLPLADPYAVSQPMATDDPAAGYQAFTVEETPSVNGPPSEPTETLTDGYQPQAAPVAPQTTPATGGDIPVDPPQTTPATGGDIPVDLKTRLDRIDADLAAIKLEQRSNFTRLVKYLGEINTHLKDAPVADNQSLPAPDRTQRSAKAKAAGSDSAAVRDPRGYSLLTWTLQAVVPDRAWVVPQAGGPAKVVTRGSVLPEGITVLAVDAAAEQVLTDKGVIRGR